ncbi:MAG: hypothetical protein KIT43_09255 [Bauldia sp.]|nr:hypothetical protein [Bauldia sp.]MCW5717561.1 hypothetical protein [Bauldia sp.]
MIFKRNRPEQPATRELPEEDVPATPATGSITLAVRARDGLAGRRIAMVATATCDPPSDLTGHAVIVLDDKGTQVARATFASFAEDRNITDEFEVEAPARAGFVTWQAVLPDTNANGVLFPETRASFPVEVKAHPSHVTVWDVPPIVSIGETFKVKVGVKCAAGCDLGGREVHIADGAGLVRGTSALLPQPWPRTAATYYCELVVRAPDDPGSYTWAAKAPPTEAGLPHLEGISAFGLHVVPPPECTVEVEAIDARTGTPVEGALVVLHPYRGFTGPNGVATIKVRRGEYSILVSKTKFDPMARTVDISGDFTTRVSLVEEGPEPDITDLYR